MENKVKVGVCGLGGFGIVCARALGMSDRAQVKAVCTRREDVAKKTGAEVGARWYTGYPEMLEREELDAVCITTPNDLHAEQSIAAMDRGLHVFCTKPMAVTLEEAEDMIEAAKRNNVKLEIGYHFRFDKRIIKMKELIEEDEIGVPFSAVTSLQYNRNPEYWAAGPWRAKLSQAGGGALTLNYIHEIDFLQWYFGPVEWVFGRVDTMVHDVEVEDVAAAVIKFKKGVLSTFTCSTAVTASKAPELEVFGTEGSISLVAEEIEDAELPYPMVSVMVHKQGKWRTVPVRDSRDVVDRWRGKLMPYTVPLQGISSIESLVAHLDEFLTCILEDKEPAVPGEEGIKATEIVQAIYRSSREGRVVELPL
ncbi:MAG: Gfo/Idh/MocA family oxidoreductase [Candidatus Bathyarchaeota archaeon]|nr:Gfo/Idh/MocA family oxidoreductase [Candidatus Bathyarchaeota archaeon]